MPSVAVLFARSNSVYKSFPNCDVFDLARDARNYAGTLPVIAHPPCRSWGRLRQFSLPRPGERELAFFAVDQVRKYGGVLEHPASTTLWPEYSLPKPGKFDSFGGWTFGVDQYWFGHRAKKSTLLYIVGCAPFNLPSLPFDLGYPQITVEHMSTAEREHTPLAFALWLVDLAVRCGGVGK